MHIKKNNKKNIYMYMHASRSLLLMQVRTEYKIAHQYKDLLEIILLV